ncbi:MAG TPA: penicillin acylase family protein [Pyrinomonadaceae bacterium]
MNRLSRTFLLIIGFGCVLATNRWPATTVAQQTPTTITIAGLHDRVTVRRDERGIPYIEAANNDDLYFAQGYITATDRLWQMDLLRRNVRGDLAEIFGEGALGEDKRHRTFGFAQVVDETAKHLPPNLNAAMTAYANGVNAFIDSLTDQTTPIEFRILQYKPRHWTPADSLAVGKLLSEYLSNSWQLDVMRGAMMSLPKEKREALLPETSALDVIIVGSDQRASPGTQASGLPKSATLDLALLQQLRASLESQRESFERLGLNPANLETFQASNNWVVSGKHTASGKPLLANDPHIPSAAPGIWYQTELTGPGMHVAGVTFPGAPGIVAGHNDYIAWGETNLGPDVQDVYIEKFDKDNSNRYLTPTGLRDAEVRHEQINVRKNPIDPKSIVTQTLDVTVTRHGPIILEKDGVRYALRWPALDPATLEAAGIFDANRARNWKEFTEALSHYSGPTQNFVYADVDGHIGYYGAGRIPIRKNGDGSVPYDGSTDAGEWTSFIPFDKLPHSFDPPSGIIVTANQRVVGRDYQYFLSHNWAPPYRARRIFDLLSAHPKLTTDDFRKIQGDVYSIASVNFARAAARTLKAVSEQGAVATGSNEQLAKLISDFESWDGMMSADSHTAVLVSQMRGAFRMRVLNAALGPDLAKTYNWAQSEVLIDRIATEQPREWLPKESVSYADLFRASYDDAKQTLTKSIGADESQWIWGKIAIARFPHPLAAAPLIGLQFTIAPFPQNGSGGSVNVGSSVSMRLIADPSDWDKTQNGIPLGESGTPNSPHWKDQLDDWRNVTPRALPFSKTAVDAATRETFSLVPKDN